MKHQLIELINQIPDVEQYFHLASNGTYKCYIVYDIPFFNDWLQGIQYELQKLIELSDSQYVKDTLDCSKKKFDGWHDKTLFLELSSRLKTIKRDIDNLYLEDKKEHDDEIKGNKEKKVFISHASKDKQYVKEIVDLLIKIGLNEKQIFCSSLSGYDIPGGKDIFEFLREQFNKFNLHVFYIHSNNYYDSSYCLNEMGAAWVLKNSCTSILLPGFKVEDMKGVVNKNEVAIKLDCEEIELKDKLNQLYDTITDEFALRKKSESLWEQDRDCFIQGISEIVG